MEKPEPHDPSSLESELREARFRIRLMECERQGAEQELYEMQNTLAQAENEVREGEAKLRESEVRASEEKQRSRAMLERLREMEREKHLQADVTQDLELLHEIARQITGRLRALSNSATWKLFRPFFSLLLSPSRLGRGPSILSDIGDLLDRHDQLSGVLDTSKLTLGVKKVPPRNRDEFAHAPAEPANPPLSATIGWRAIGQSLARENGPPVRLRFGITVTESEERTGAGDLYTARGLAAALEQELGWSCRLLGRNDPGANWYDTRGLDAVVVLLESYDLRRVQDPIGKLLKIAWIRNWTDQWVRKPEFRQFDIVLCSSQKMADYVEERTGMPAHVFRIAADTRRFHPDVAADPKFASDYCFTGNHWGAPRAIDALDPSTLHHDFALFGRGWDTHERFAASLRGPVPFDRMPAVYASTKILIDDANHVTRPWGSVNSRVFEALACGTLVITNGVEGARELFGDCLPAYSYSGELQQQLRWFIENESERASLARQLQAKVLNAHSYNVRAAELKFILANELSAKARIAIKVRDEERASSSAWSDTRYAARLAAALRGLGYAVRVDLRPSWNVPHALRDDVILVLGGPVDYRPEPGNVALRWITGPIASSEHEVLDRYSQIFLASKPYATRIAPATSAKLAVLKRAEALAIRTAVPKKPASVFFLGDFTGSIPKVVDHAIDAGINVTIIGKGWNGVRKQAHIGGQQLDTRVLNEIGAHHGVVLCEIPAELADNGFIPFQVEEIIAAGATPVCREISGLDDSARESMVTYDGAAEALGRRFEEAFNQASPSAVPADQLCTREKVDRFESLACLVDAAVCRASAT